MGVLIGATAKKRASCQSATRVCSCLALSLLLSAAQELYTLKLARLVAYCCLAITQTCLAGVRAVVLLKATGTSDVLLFLVQDFSLAGAWATHAVGCMAVARAGVRTQGVHAVHGCLVSTGKCTFWKRMGPTHALVCMAAGHALQGVAMKLP